ncbi:MAG: FixH family protein [Burkholderiales bacterium]|nr:FixH family protein [Burkholderiales bacterium]
MTAPASGPLPWYRHRWPWLLMAGPFIVVVAGFATLWLAVASDDGLVADDYYKRGLAINRTLERTQRAAALGLEAVVDVDAAGAARVTLAAASGERSGLPTAVRLLVVHPTRAGQDRRADLVVGPDRAYVGRIEPLPAGRWLVSVESDDWRLPPVEAVAGLRGVRVPARSGP